MAIFGGVIGGSANATAAATTLERSVVSSGGAAAASVLYTLTDTVGQPVVGPASSTTYAVGNGFWADYGETPVPGTMNLGAVDGQTTTLATSKLLARATDPNGETLSVVSVGGTSANGGSVVLSGNNVYYIPPAGYTGPDTFTYVIADPGGDAVTVTVTVNVSAGNIDGGSGLSYNFLSAKPVGNDVQLSFLAIPANRYALDRTFNLTAPIHWDPQLTNVASDNGLLVVTNTPVAGTNNFWRTRFVP